MRLTGMGGEGRRRNVITTRREDNSKTYYGIFHCSSAVLYITETRNLYT